MLSKWTDETETKSIERNLELLETFLEDKIDFECPRQYIITEYFPPKGKLKIYVPHKYELYNLQMWIENDGIIYFDDAKGFLEESMYNEIIYKIKAFTKDSVLYIGFKNNKITISFSDGYIQICY